MLDPEINWKTTFASLPQSDNQSVAAQNLADAVDGLTTNKLEVPAITGTPASFTFNKSVFKSQIESLSPTDDADQGAENFATAWKSAIDASTMLVVTGASVGIPTPATTFSVVTSTVIDPASSSSAKSTLKNDLKNLPQVSSALASEFGPKFRQAFLNLTVTVTGVNSVAPTPGPLVLTSSSTG